MMAPAWICVMSIAVSGFANSLPAAPYSDHVLVRGDSDLVAQDKRIEKIKRGNCKIVRKWKGDTFTEKKKCKGGSQPT